jgi:hypothetical protein
MRLLDSIGVDRDELARHPGTIPLRPLHRRHQPRSNACLVPDVSNL